MTTKKAAWISAGKGLNICRNGSTPPADAPITKMLGNFGSCFHYTPPVYSKARVFVAGRRSRIKRTLGRGKNHNPRTDREFSQLLENVRQFKQCRQLRSCTLVFS